MSDRVCGVFEGGWNAKLPAWRQRLLYNSMAYFVVGLERDWNAKKGLAVAIIKTQHRAVKVWRWKSLLDAITKSL